MQKKIRHVIAENIPQELTQYRQWVAWRAKPKDNGRIDKIPINPLTGRNAQTNNPETWGSYEEAIEFYRKHKEEGIAGIGFVFTETDPFCGIDLDDCRNPGTNKYEKWARDILEELNSYAEISPSNTGVKIFIKGKLPGGGRNKGEIEVYDNGRFFTVTGGRLRKYPHTVENRQDKITELYARLTSQPAKTNSSVETPQLEITDKEILKKARTAKNGHKFERLYQGDWSRYLSQSEADLALCSELAFWCQKRPDQMERIFKTSSLMRDKWDEKHHGDGRTYGQATIEKAIENTTDTYSPTKISEDDGNIIHKKMPRGLNLSDLQEQFSAEISWIWRTHFPARLPCTVNGREGTGKTTVCMVAAREILQAHPQGTVIWLATEGAVQDTVNKAVALGLTSDRFLVAQKSDESFQFNFKGQTDLRELDTLLEQNESVLAVFIDSIRGMSSLGDNDSEIGHIMHKLNAIVCDKHKAGLIYIDHHKKGAANNLLDKSVGTTAKTAAVRLVLSVLRESNFRRKIVVAKTNFLQPIPELEVIRIGDNFIIQEPKKESDETMGDKAEKFLIQLFSEQTTYPAKEVFQRGEERGINEATLKKVKMKLGIKSSREGPNIPWMWSRSISSDSGLPNLPNDATT